MKLEIKIPENYCEKAREELIQIVATLEADTSVSKLDTPAINLLGSFMDTYYKAQAIVETDGMILRPVGSSPKRAHPACKIMHEAGMKMYRLMKEFNMTPDSRGKNGKEHSEDPPSMFEAMLGKKVEKR